MLLSSTNQRDSHFQSEILVSKFLQLLQNPFANPPKDETTLCLASETQKQCYFIQRYQLQLRIHLTAFNYNNYFLEWGQNPWLISPNELTIISIIICPYMRLLCLRFHVTLTTTIEPRYKFCELWSELNELVYAPSMGQNKSTSPTIKNAPTQLL